MAMIRPAVLYYGNLYRERCVKEMRDTTCRVGMPVKLSAQGLKPNVRPHIVMSGAAPWYTFDEHTRCVVVATFQNQLLLLHTESFEKFCSRPRNWEPADDA